MINNTYNPFTGLLSLNDDYISDGEDNKIILDAKERIKKRREDKNENIEKFMKQFREYITELEMDNNYSYKIVELNNKYKNMFDLEKQIIAKKNKKKNTYAEQLIGNLVDDLDDIKVDLLVDKKVPVRNNSPIKIGSIFDNYNPIPSKQLDCQDYNIYGYTGGYPGGYNYPQIISHPITQQTICLSPQGYQYNNNHNIFHNNTISNQSTGYNNILPVKIMETEMVYKKNNFSSECNYCAINGILNKFGKVPYHLESECFNKYPSKRPNNYKERSPSKI